MWVFMPYYQVVMGLQKPLTIEKGEKLYGIIKLTPDLTQHRLTNCLTILNIFLLSDTDRGLMNDNSSHVTRSSLGLHLATSFSGSKSEEREERDYLL